MKNFYQTVQLKMLENEQKISFNHSTIIEDSRNMTLTLKTLLEQLKKEVMSRGFINEAEEIEFFKTMKPTILGKLLFYNKVFRIETSRPSKGGEIYKHYYEDKLEHLERYYKDAISKSKFYQYYRSGSNQQDNWLFIRGNIDIRNGVKGFVFESDPGFSTYYDYKVSKIIECDLLYDYLILRLEEYSGYNSAAGKSLLEQMQWVDSKNALIELLYGLYAVNSLASSELQIKKLALIFEQVFNVQLGDIHHAFHRMKYRTGDRCLYLTKMKKALERYMDDGFID